MITENGYNSDSAIDGLFAIKMIEERITLFK